MFRAGTVGLLCAAYEVEIEPGTETHKGTIRPVRDCSNIATELLITPESTTALCPTCCNLIRESPQIGVVERAIHPESN